MSHSNPLSDSELSDLEIAAREYLTASFIDASDLDPSDPAIQAWLLDQTYALGYQLSHALRAYVDFELTRPPGEAD